MSSLIIDAPRWLLLGALIFAPWAYGGTRPWTIEVLNLWLTAVLGLWGLGCVARRDWPTIHPVLLGASVLLALQAGWMVLNAQYDYDATTHEFVKLQPLAAWAPGTVHQSLSAQMAVRVSLLLGIGCFACDLARHPVWRQRVWWTVVLAGVSLVVFGLIQRMAGAPSIYWGNDDAGRSFFAAYRYHSNAGAFVNLAWPIVAAFALTAFHREAPKLIQSAWLTALILCLTGIVVIASRAAGILALVLFGIWLAWFVFQRARGGFAEVNPAVSVITLGLGLLLVAAVAALVGLDTSSRRWGKFGQEFSLENKRLLVNGVCLDMIPDAGCWGMGPGTFQTAFPHYTERLGNALAGVWTYAHDDYLQTLIEWGYVGGLGWAVLVFGGVGYSGWVAFRTSRRVSFRTRAVHFGMLTAVLGVLLHALVDFPLQIASIQLYVVVFLGMLWASRCWYQDHEPTPGKGVDAKNALQR